jgi:hypothetical protein
MEGLFGEGPARPKDAYYRWVAVGDLKHPLIFRDIKESSGLRVIPERIVEAG